MTRKFLTTILLMTTLLSCKFSKPILTIPYGKETRIHPLSQETVKTRHFDFLCLRTGLTIGGGLIKKTYNLEGQIISKHIFKITYNGDEDRDYKCYKKEISYDTTGSKNKIHFMLTKYQDQKSTIVYVNTIDKAKK